MATTAAANALILATEYLAWSGIDPADPDPATLDSVQTDINAASALIELACRRTIKSGVIVNEEHDGDDTPLLRLDRPPVTVLTAVSLVSSDGVTTTAVDLASIRLSANQRDLILVSLLGDWTPVWPRGRRNIRVSYTGGYTPVPEALQLACRLEVAALQGARGKDPRMSGHQGGGHSVQLDRIDPMTGLPEDVAALIARYKLLLIAAPASRVISTSE